MLNHLEVGGIDRFILLRETFFLWKIVRVLGWLLAGEHIRLSAACNDMMENKKHASCPGLAVGWQRALEFRRQIMKRKNI